MVATQRELETEVERLKLLLANEQASHRNFRAEMISDPIISGVLSLRSKIGFMQLVIDGSKPDDEGAGASEFLISG